MHLDCYDRRILTFVLDRAPRSRRPAMECQGWFGMRPSGVLRRFDAVIDAYTPYQIALDEPDLELLSLAARHRSVMR